MNCGNMKLSLRSIWFCPAAYITSGVQVLLWEGVEIRNIFRLFLIRMKKKKVSRTEKQGTCVLQLIALMDVSTTRLSVPTMDNGRERRLSNSYILLVYYELMPLSSSWIGAKLGRFSNICQPDVPVAHVVIALCEEPWSRPNRPLNPFFCTVCEVSDAHARGRIRNHPVTANTTERGASSSPTADATESKQRGTKEVDHDLTRRWVWNPFTSCSTAALWEQRSGFQVKSKNLPLIGDLTWYRSKRWVN